VRVDIVYSNVSTATDAIDIFGGILFLCPRR